MPKARPPVDRKVVIYLRISQDSAGDAAGVGRQRADCERLCAAKGWSVVEVVTDNDESASRYRRGVRPGWAQVLGLLDSGAANAIVAYDLDRITRSPRDLEDLIDRADNGLPVVTVQGTLALDTGDGRAMARVLLAMAAKASDDTSRRVRRMKLDLATAGRPTGGIRVFGFTDNGTVQVPAEAKAIRDAASQVLAGSSLGDIARRWNAAGFKPRGGGRAFTVTAVRNVLSNPRNAGLNVYQGEVIGQGTWEPILDRATYERVHRMLSDPNRTRTPPRRTAFTGLFVCGKCASPMSRDSSHQTKVWRCKLLPGYPRCGGVSVNANSIEAYITECLFIALDSPALAKAMRPNRPLPDRTIVELEDVEQRRSDLAALFAAGDISRSEWMAARQPLEARFTALQAAAARTQRSAILDASLTKPGALRAIWDDLSDDRRHSVLTAVIERIDIATAASPHAPIKDRVTIAWRA